MSAGDVLVRHASLSVAATSGERAVRGLDALETALRAALARFAREIGNEFVVIDTLELVLQVMEAGRSVRAAELEIELFRALRARVTAAPSQSAHFSVAHQVARFSSESTALAEYLRAIAQGNTKEWPFRALRSYGMAWDDVLSGCLARDRLFLADVLASVSRLLNGETLAQQTGDTLTARIVAEWTSGAHRSSTRAQLPDEISSSLRASARSSEASLGPRGRLQILVQLFALWPPARALAFTTAELDELAGRRSGAEPTAERRASTGGGLLVMAKLYDECDLERALTLAYPEPRSRRVVRWVIGRALENARLSSHDPLLSMWAGESYDAIIAPLRALASVDPEPLHRLAFEAAQRAGLLAELRLVPFGDEIVLLAAEQMVVDSASGDDAHEALPELVRRFTLHCNRAPDELSVLTNATTSDIDAIADVDAPGLPRSWQPAVRAAASLTRALLSRWWQAQLSDVRGWPAIAVNEDEIEIRRSDSAKVADGAWLGAVGVVLGERRRRVKLV